MGIKVIILRLAPSTIEHFSWYVIVVTLVGVMYQDSENFRVQKFSGMKLSSQKIFSCMRASVQKLKTLIISKEGKIIIIVCHHVKDYGRTAKGVVYSRTPYIQWNIEFSHWRGGAM